MRVLERKQCSHVNLMALYEANFDKFVSLIPGESPGELVLLGVANGFSLRLRAIDRAPYTTTWQVMVQYTGSDTLWACPQFKVRLYHDAKVLEVLYFQGHGRFQGDYPYPNPWMYARDEKRQVNRFFGELLGYCVVNGYLPTALA
ncbi:MAG: DUF1249 domain-containing protein [Pseudomonadota bacterium]